MKQRSERWLAWPLLVVLLALGGCAAGVMVGGGKGGESAQRYPSEADARITAEVNRRLVADPQVPAMDVNVATLDGVVTLSGSVPSAASAARTATLARGVAGVKAVHNNLRVGR